LNIGTDTRTCEISHDIKLPSLSGRVRNLIAELSASVNGAKINGCLLFN